MLHIDVVEIHKKNGTWRKACMCHLLVVRKEYSIRLDKWHKTKAKRQLTNVYWHIFFCRGDVVTSFSGIINNIKITIINTIKITI